MSGEYAEEYEWSLDAFMAECDRVVANPPSAPDGLELIECDANPRHWPTYVAHVDGMYPAPCPSCMYEGLSETSARLEHEARHHFWHRSRITKWFARHGYAWGIISGSSWSNGCAHGCRSLVRVYWRGRRPYILGVQRETWACLLKHGHIRTATYATGGLCSKCLPCPDCGSTASDHSACGGAA